MTNVSTWQAPMVTLVDGREVPSDSEEWRHECEARHVLNLPNKLARQALLSKIEEKRGDKADPQNIKGKLERRRIEDKIMALWKASRPAGAA